MRLSKSRPYYRLKDVMYSCQGLSLAHTDISKAFILLLVTLSLTATSYGHRPPEFGDVEDDVGRDRFRRANGDNMTTTVTTTMTTTMTTELPLVLGDGTTAHLEEIFLGRCYDCEFCSDAEKQSYNCSSLWDAFTSSFVYQEPCTSVPEDFDDYADQAFTPLAAGQTLFYSGLYSMAMVIGRESPNFTNIELTMLGRVVDGITFCGQTDAPGINYDACPSFGSCENETQAAFWKKSSQHFAGEARGDVTVLLDGSRVDGAYRPTSFFRSQEVANLDPAKVTSLTAYVVHNLEGVVTEKCVTGSLLELQRDITDKGIQFDCIDDPSITRHVQCIQDPGHDLCQPCTDSAPTTFGTTMLLILLSQLLSILSVM